MCNSQVCLAVTALIVCAATGCSKETTPEKSGPESAQKPELFVPNDLRVHFTKITMQKNSYQEWKLAENSIIPRTEEIEALLKKLQEGRFNETGISFENAAITKWINENEEPLRHFENGVQCGQFQIPAEDEYEDRKLSPQKLGILIDALEIKISRNMYSKEWENATKDLGILLQAANIISERAANGGLLFFAFGCKCRESALRCIAEAATNPECPQKALERMLKLLESTEDSFESLRRALRSEFRISIVQPIKMVVEGDDKFGYLRRAFSELYEKSKKKSLSIESRGSLDDVEIEALNVSKTVKWAASFYTRALDNTKKPWKEVDFGISEEVSRQSIAWRAKVMPDVNVNSTEETGRKDATGVAENAPSLDDLDNYIGKAIGFIGIPGFHRSIHLAFTEEAEKRAVLQVLAIQLYQRHRGQLPAGLEAIVGDGILRQLPLDPFSGNVFRFSKERSILWSVGLDGIDNEGSSSGNPIRYNNKDMIWSVPTQGMKTKDSDEKDEEKPPQSQPPPAK